MKKDNILAFHSYTLYITLVTILIPTSTVIQNV